MYIRKTVVGEQVVDTKMAKYYPPMKGLLSLCVNMNEICGPSRKEQTVSWLMNVGVIEGVPSNDEHRRLERVI